MYDLNRAGTPLLEIVTLPDIESAEEAGEYVRSLQALLRIIAVSDGMMEAVSSFTRYGDESKSRSQLFCSLASLYFRGHCVAT